MGRALTDEENGDAPLVDPDQVDLQYISGLLVSVSEGLVHVTGYQQTDPMHGPVRNRVMLRYVIPIQAAKKAADDMRRRLPRFD